MTEKYKTLHSHLIQEWDVLKKAPKSLKRHPMYRARRKELSGLLQEIKKIRKDLSRGHKYFSCLR